MHSEPDPVLNHKREMGQQRLEEELCDKTGQLQRLAGQAPCLH